MMVMTMLRMISQKLLEDRDYVLLLLVLTEVLAILFCPNSTVTSVLM